ncbi:hypothetical protein GOFOIKOB_6506 [Methylobacterium tardum]|nr:hypothetical protein GOFOIKOB_6506 [Methylobacterium tardum]
MVGPRATVAIPVRNGANFLAEAIDSALAQTYANLEVFVVDDGSDDGGATAGIAWAYGERIRFIQQANTGVAGALNRVLHEMTGELFCWLSHDDVFEPTKVATQVALYVRLGSPQDALLYSDLSWIDEKGEITGIERFDRRELTPRPWLAFYDGQINGCTILAPRRLLLEIGGIAEGYPHTQDYRTWWCLSRQARFVHIPIPLVRVRQHRNQGSHTQAARQESNAFWTEVIEQTSELEAALLDGSRERFLRRSADFLRYRSPNRAAADRALDLAGKAASEVRVSVVLDLGADGLQVDPVGAGRAVASVLAQTRPPDQLVLVGERAALAESARAAIAASSIVATWVASGEARVTARLRAGLMMATGFYVAFLLAPDIYEPGKIAQQVEAMSAGGYAISHTSYTDPDGTCISSGCFAGTVYPEVLGGSPLETSTVMIHRVLWASGVLFVEPDYPPGASWIEAVAGRALLGLEQPLSRLRPTARSDGAQLLRWAEAHPRHREHSTDLKRLRAATRRDCR